MSICDPAPAPGQAPTDDQRYRMLQFLTWERKPEDVASPGQQARKRELAASANASLAPTCYIADSAQVFTERLVVGEQSWIAGFAVVRGDVEIGAHSTVNSFACISGQVRIGDGVRIASHVSIVGFNHNFEDCSRPIWRQGVSHTGITISGDAWIGANAVIVDGVTIGEGAVVAAGAVVTRDVAPFTIVGGVPARKIRSRIEEAPASAPAVRQGAGTEEELVRLGQAAASQWPDILARNRDAEGYLSLEADGRARRSIRHVCDAIEIAAGFGALPDGLGVAETVDRLAGLQDPETGLFPDPYQLPRPGRALRDDGLALYNVLAVGYALECLGAAPRRPIAALAGLSADGLGDWLDALPWQDRAWSAGSAVDAAGTALYFNTRYHGLAHNREALFGWLVTRCRRSTGLWGDATPEEGLLQPVNGFYRLTRGTYAQFGLPVPYPEAAVNSVIANYRNHGGFDNETWTACNLLDTIHPLWLLGTQTDHRRREALDIAAEVIGRTAALWHPGQGFAFARGQQPSLQGTEMWLSVVHLAALMLELGAGFAFVPKGVHRTRPAGLGLQGRGQ